MKAIVYETYGSPDVLEFRDVETPTPNDTQVVVRVRAAAANPLDWHAIRGLPYLFRMDMGLRRPKRHSVGVDFSGIVETVGSGVTEFRPGDEVYGSRGGAFAECVLSSKQFVAPKPASLSFEQAAGVPVAGITALQGLRDHGKVQPGHSVLVNGAAGGVGTFAVQLAKILGARVTGVCSTRNVELVRSLGADHVIDYTRENFTKLDQRYDVVFDLIGNHSLGACRRVLRPSGRVIVCSGGTSPKPIVFGPVLRIAKAKLLSPFTRKKMTFFLANTTPPDLTYLATLFDAGALKVVIDRTYPLASTADAIRYIEQGHARGKVVITV